MSEGWTPDRVMQLAPDPASAKAGQGLSSIRKWVSVGCDAGAVWGECQGSGAKPYQVQVELAESAFKCSCPSRKFPCKHSLGLMLLWTANEVKVSTRPAWVDEWLASRADRAKKKQEKAEEPPKPLDAEAQGKRRAKRVDRVREGIASLRIWAEDLIRTGIASAPSQGYGHFDEPARRMIDAQAPGAARMIRQLGSIAMSGAGWQEPFLRQLAVLHLLTSAVDQIENLPKQIGEDVLTVIGVPQGQDEVLGRAGVADRWHVLAQEVELEDRLRVQRTWLFGSTTRRPAMVLTFAHGTGPLDASLQPGTGFDGEVCFFGDNQIRAAVKNKSTAVLLEGLPGLESLDAACAVFGRLLTGLPWLEEAVVPLRAVVPTHIGEQWYLTDARQEAMTLNCSNSGGWLLMALSGGTPIDVAVAMDGSRLRPLAAMVGGRYATLTVRADVGG
ncbi:MAG TPA: SWIM zinc finger family protein [Tepidisphaeraceae bacterium]|nr:SWIM zinc finger family protein [Tepidisphaeraceae bacterium]